MTRGPVDLSPVTDHLDAVRRRGYDTSMVVDAWLDAMVLALAEGDTEAAYRDVADRFHEDVDGDGDHPMRDLARALGGLLELHADVEDGPADILGRVYEEWGTTSDALGQHFTPMGVSRAMAELVSAVEETEDGDQRECISDPACGSGRLLLFRGARSPDALCVGWDKSARCAKMTALNLCLHNLDGVVVHGNSLTREAWAAWEVASTPVGGAIRQADPSDLAGLDPAEPAAAADD